YSKANRAPWSSRLAISSARRLVDSCQTNSTAAMTMTAPIQELSCLCRLTHATKRAENPSPVPPTTGATEAAVAFVAVAISVLFYLGCSTNVHAPGVTRTPGQRFRKPLLYPPELQGHIRGRKRRNVRELGVVQQGLDAPSLQPLPAL